MATIDDLLRHRVHPRMDGGVAAIGELVRDLRSDVEHQPGRGHVRGKGVAPVDGLEAERRDQPRSTVGAPPVELRHDAVDDGLVGVEVGLARVVLELEVHPRPGARVQGLGERRDVGRKSAARRLDEHAAIPEDRVVVHHEDPVGGAPDVELDAVRAQLDRSLEGGHRVLPLDPGRAPVGDDRGHSGTVPLVNGQILA
jgi:hypothetical protein